MSLIFSGCIPKGNVGQCNLALEKQDLKFYKVALCAFYLLIPGLIGKILQEREFRQENMGKGKCKMHIC